MRRDLVIGLCLFFGTLILFWSATGNEFVDYDDGLYVFENRMVQGGFTKESIHWAFTTHHASNWHPLTWFSHMLDAELYGLAPFGHHATSVGLHALNVVLLFVLALRLTGALWSAALVAAFFAWHPLRVESVAWVAERKDLLSGFFGLLSLFAYVEYVRQGSKRALVASVLACALSLMSKPMLVTMPCVLVLLDVWPLGRWIVPAKAGGPLVPLRVLLLEKVPFFVLSAAMCVLTVWAQKAGGSMVSVETLSLPHRIANVLAGYLGYLEKTVWPMDLAVLYPLQHQIPWARAMAGAVVLALVSAWALARVRQRPWFAVGWFWFLGTLVPVIGLVQVGRQSMADRYTYFPSIGLSLILAWALRGWVVNEAKAKLASVAMGTVLVMCALLTHFQIGVWANTVTLFRNDIEVTTDNELAHNNLGNALLKRGETEAAVEHLAEAVRLRPSYAEAMVNYGLALSEMKRFDEAREQFRAAIQLRPRLAPAHYYLGVSLASDKAVTEAKAHLLQAVEHAEDKVTMRIGVADVLIRLEQFTDAEAMLEEVLRVDGGKAAAWQLLGVTRLQLRRPVEAAEAWRRALALSPDTPGAVHSLARLLATHPELANSSPAETVRLAEQARLLIGVSDPLALDTLAAAYANAGRMAEAVSTAELALDAAAKAGRGLLTTEIAGHLELYRQGRPLRETVDK